MSYCKCRMIIIYQFCNWATSGKTYQNVSHMCLSTCNISYYIQHIVSFYNCEYSQSFSIWSMDNDNSISGTFILATCNVECDTMRKYEGITQQGYKLILSTEVWRHQIFSFAFQHFHDNIFVEHEEKPSHTKFYMHRFVGARDLTVWIHN